MEIEEVSNSDELNLFAIGTSSKPKPLTCEVIIEGSPLVMGIDTGAEVSIIRRHPPGNIPRTTAGQIQCLTWPAQNIY